MLNCPICNERYVAQCKCPLGERSCVNSHYWYTCLVHNIVVIGKSNHNISTTDCHCNDYPENFIIGPDSES
jgi:hypothetical protein